MTTSSAGVSSEQERLDQLYSADRDLGFVLLGFPFATFSGALLIGFWGTLQRMPHRSDVPLWIALGFCVAFTAATLLSTRSASRSLARAGLPAQEIRRRIARMWIGVAVFMLLAGLYVLGDLFLTFDPERGRAVLFGTVDHPVPLAISFVFYVMAGALLLGKSWREHRGAASRQTGQEAALPRVSEIHLANRCSEGVILFVIATFLLAALIAVRHVWKPEILAIMAFLGLAACLGMLMVRRSRPHFEAAGLSRDEVREQMAATWRLGGGVIVSIAACALLCLAFVGRELDRSELLWLLGSTVCYTLLGILLLWGNRQKRST
jgi:hypothetical protein